MVPPQVIRLGVVPYLILAAALILTAVASVSAARTYSARDRFRFENAAERVKAAIENRLDSYIAMLLGGAGLFAASDEVSFEEFQRYVERLELPRRYPGIQGMGYSRVIPPEERETVAAEIRRRVPTFRYWPEQPGLIHAIVYLEPQDARNRLALGYDMFAEPTRQVAMALARDTAAPAASRRVILVQEDLDRDNRQPGFLIYVPVYEGGDIPATVEERRARLRGFVYSPFRAHDLLEGILGQVETGEVNFELYDGAPAEQQLLVHAGNSGRSTGRFETVRQLEIGGRPWTLTLRAGPAFARTSARTLVWLVITGGVVFSMLLFAVTQTQVRARAEAERTAEELRATSDALKEANRAKDEFLAIVSHELRTPLNAIVGWTAMLRRGQVAPDHHHHAIEVIERNAAAQARLVEDLLDLSRAVAGRLRLEWRSVDVSEALRTAVDAMRPAARAKSVTLGAELADTLGTIPGDQARLQQVVLNLLANAIKFTPEGGAVTLRAEGRDGVLTIEVRDNGIGIRPEFLPYVFDRFRQADTSTTRAYSGVGLGLAITRHIVELHGGTITITSQGENRGTSCTVRLPAAG